jgi:hypothetical protein
MMGIATSAPPQHLSLRILESHYPVRISRSTVSRLTASRRPETLVTVLYSASHAVRCASFLKTHTAADWHGDAVDPPVAPRSGTLIHLMRYAARQLMDNDDYS